MADLDNLVNDSKEDLKIHRLLESNLGEYQGRIEQAIEELEQQNILSRIWDYDHTVWSSDPDEITNRLGWLESPELMQDTLSEILELVSTLRREGYTSAVLLGMGGSSLAPEMFDKTFGVAEGYLDLRVLDSTDPASVIQVKHAVDLKRTLFIVATKSGGTVETLSFLKYFYNQVAADLGVSQAGDHFIAITDPGSRLEGLADQLHFRKVFLNDPNIGGRYSALSYFGLVPAGLIGLDLTELLGRAKFMARRDGHSQEHHNPGILLGAILGELALEGRDKLTLITSPQVSSFGDWVEQLIAESTGKEGMGILPVVGEPLAELDLYGDDRVFVFLQLKGEDRSGEGAKRFGQAGHPVVKILIEDLYDLGGQIFLWELATAIASQRLGINPFDQPNVESAKVLARRKMEQFEQHGSIDEKEADLEVDRIGIYLSPDVRKSGSGTSPMDLVRDFIEKGADGGYVSLQVYVQPNEGIDLALRDLRHKLMQKTNHATTSGYGPRFLHSTGQLHKGDAGHGTFIQITAEDPVDIPIPVEAGSDESKTTFGLLKRAQAQGDREALLNAGRRVIRFHLKGDVLTGIETISSWLS